MLGVSFGLSEVDGRKTGLTFGLAGSDGALLTSFIMDGSGSSEGGGGASSCGGTVSFGGSALGGALLAGGLVCTEGSAGLLSATLLGLFFLPHLPRDSTSMHS